MKGINSLIILFIIFCQIEYNQSDFCSEYCNDCDVYLFCSSCNDHYYLYWNSCKECINNCKKCENSDECTECYSKYYLSSRKTCERCPTNCEKCSSSNTCDSCERGYFPLSSQCYQFNINCKTTNDNCKCDTCYDGYYKFNYQCLKCDSNCKTCSSSASNCLSCNYGYYLSSSKTCIKCSTLCKTCSSENNCNSCIDNYFPLSNQCYQCNINCKTTNDNCKCDTCYDGYYISNYQCLKCNSNCRTCSNSPKNCLSCNDGYFLSSSICIKCSTPCKTCSNETQCTSCIDNYFLISDKCYQCNVNCNTSNDGCKCDSCYGGYYLKNYQCINCAELNCNNCPNGFNKLIKNKTQCINDCRKDDIFQYEYNNSCHHKCPNNTYILEDIDDYKCFDYNPVGYYLDKINEVYKKCYETCSMCNNGGNKTIHNCLECKDNYIFYNNSKNINNCYKKCEQFHYFDESNEYHCTKTCEGKYNKAIVEKNICIDFCKNDDMYKYDFNNNCVEHCPNEATIDEINYMCIKNVTNHMYDERDLEIEIFRQEIFNFDINNNTKDIIKNENNVQYQITSSDNQKKNTDKNISSIDLGECETKLKDIYHIEQSLPLIIFKIDYFEPDKLNIPIIGYEIYHPIQKRN